MAPIKLVLSGMHYPSITRRMACWMYEGVLLFGVVWLSGYLFSSITQSKHALQNRLGLQLFLLLTLCIYFVWFWQRGQTLAMKTWRIKLVTQSGQRLRHPHAFGRFVLSWLWFIPPLLSAWISSLPMGTALGLLFAWIAVYAMMALHLPKRQFLHDVLANTRLVQSD